MSHALRRISYATCEAARALFAFVAREPRCEPAPQLCYCHAFETDTPAQVTSSITACVCACACRTRQNRNILEMMALKSPLPGIVSGYYLFNGSRTRSPQRKQVLSYYKNVLRQMNLNRNARSRSWLDVVTGLTASVNAP
ncbi:jg25385 [Pararge aegeria aegeria]|uniref:Jg25385 protein n=1 Tax=Pararge aegeria aegeria TaxID=348720 RepID=A0A8S4RYP9_9NEOP|nr:jg25385 [Pararge aegeria aegeria]